MSGAFPERHVAALRDDLEPAVREQDADHSASDAEPVTYTMQDECRDGYATATLRQSHPSRRSRTTAAAAVRLNAAGGVNRCADGSSANHAGEEAARAGRVRLGVGASQAGRVTAGPARRAVRRSDATTPTPPTPRRPRRPCRPCRPRRPRRLSRLVVEVRQPAPPVAPVRITRTSRRRRGVAREAIGASRGGLPEVSPLEVPPQHEPEGNLSGQGEHDDRPRLREPRREESTVGDERCRQNAAAHDEHP